MILLSMCSSSLASDTGALLLALLLALPSSAVFAAAFVCAHNTTRPQRDQLLCKARAINKIDKDSIRRS